MRPADAKARIVKNKPVMCSAPTPATPTVSVIIATYNRSQVLRHAIQSVRTSSLTDWELIVVGDACTDDTAGCVASFTDPRIFFVNRPSRCGDQSGPNNHGVALSRGRYVAFLNHDDLYLPDHLAACVAELELSGADLVWVPCVAALPKTDSAAGDRPCRFAALTGVPVASGYSPLSFYSASSWVFRRSLADRVGPWPASDRVYVSSSQAWLFRAWGSGAALRFLPTVSVILVPAQPGSYARRESPEHEWLARWFRDAPRYREKILEEAAVSEAMQHITDIRYRPLRAILRLLLAPVHALLTALGIHPRSLQAAILYGSRGEGVRKHREVMGVP